MVLDNVLLKKIEGFKQFVANMIPIAGNHTPSSDTTNGSSGTNMDYARSDHTHPKSTLYAEANHTHSADDLPSTMALSAHTHGNLQNDGRVGTSDNASKNVVTDGNGKITTEAKPTVPQASTSSPLADMTGGAIGSDSKYAKADHQHPKSNLYAESVHTHSQYLTTHQDISGKLNIAQTSYKGKNVVVDNTTGNITFEDKPTVPQASTSSPLADMTGGAIGSDSKYAKADHQHPKSTLYAEANHTHSANDLPSTMAPSAHTHGNLQNDGRVGTSDNASKNVVTDGNGKITTEAKITMVDTVQDGNSNAVTSNAVYDYVNSVIGDADDWLTS